MPYENYWDEKGLHRKFTGNICGKEILDSNLSIQGDARFDEIKYVLNDFSLINKFKLTEHDINIISTIDNVAAISKKSLKIAIVTTDTELLKWAKLYLEMMQGSPYIAGVFDSYNDAHNWVS